MNQKEMMAAIYNYAYLNDARQNASYKFTDAEAERFDRAIRACYDRISKLAEPHFNQEVEDKIYGE